MSDLTRKADALPIFCMRCVRVIDCANDMTGKFKNNCPIKKEVDELPSAEPEIIRCKDCKHWMREKLEGFELPYGDCESPDIWDCIRGNAYDVIAFQTNEDFYCGFAERTDG